MIHKLSKYRKEYNPSLANWLTLNHTQIKIGILKSLMWPQLLSQTASEYNMSKCYKIKLLQENLNFIC